MVLSFDRYSRDDVIGEVMLELDSIDLSNSDNTPVPIYKEITPRSYKVSYIHGPDHVINYVHVVYFLDFFLSRVHIMNIYRRKNSSENGCRKNYLFLIGT